MDKIRCHYSGKIHIVNVWFFFYVMYFMFSRSDGALDVTGHSGIALVPPVVHRPIIQVVLPAILHGGLHACFGHRTLLDSFFFFTPANNPGQLHISFPCCCV